MDKHFKNIVDELNQLVPTKNKHQIIEARANHVISSAINLLNLIKESYNTDESNELIKRFYLSLKNEDLNKFNRGIKKIKEKKNQ